MRYKTLSFVILSLSVIALWSANSELEFTTPKKSKNLPARQLKTQSLTEIGNGLDLILKLDRLTCDLRGEYQAEFEAGLYGEGGNCINCDRLTRQSYLNQIQEINLELHRSLDLLQVKINKLKKITSKNSSKG